MNGSENIAPVPHFGHLAHVEVFIEVVPDWRGLEPSLGLRKSAVKVFLVGLVVAGHLAHPARRHHLGLREDILFLRVFLFFRGCVTPGNGLWLRSELLN